MNVKRLKVLLSVLALCLLRRLAAQVDKARCEVIPKELLRDPRRQFIGEFRNGAYRYSLKFFRASSAMMWSIHQISGALLFFSDLLRMDVFGRMQNDITLYTTSVVPLKVFDGGTAIDVDTLLASGAGGSYHRQACH